MNRFLVLIIALMAIVVGTSGQTSTAPSIISQLLSFTDYTFNGTPIWIIVTVVAGGCGIIILILLILLCYACCSKKNNGTGEYRKVPVGELKTSECQTEFVPDNLHVILTESGTMTKRSAWKRAHESIKPVEEPKLPEERPLMMMARPRQLHQIVELHFANNNSSYVVGPGQSASSAPTSANEAAYLATARPMTYNTAPNPGGVAYITPSASAAYGYGAPAYYPMYY